MTLDILKKVYYKSIILSCLKIMGIEQKQEKV